MGFKWLCTGWFKVCKNLVGRQWVGIEYKGKGRASSENPTHNSQVDWRPRISISSGYHFVFLSSKSRHKSQS